MTVKQIQHLLAYLGYYRGNIDGDWGIFSKTACTAFQKEYGGIMVDGWAGSQTQKALKDAVARDLFPQTPDLGQSAPETGSFWKEVEYFTRAEFGCRCGGKYCNGFPAEPDETLVRLVNDLRRQAGRPAHCSSGLRCPTWNARQGGVVNSKHRYGKALDFYIEGIPGTKLLAMAQADPRTNYAYIIEGQYVHVDVQ